MTNPTQPTGSITDPLVTHFLEQMDLNGQAENPHIVVWTMYNLESSSKAIRSYWTPCPKPGATGDELTLLGKHLGAIIRDDNLAVNGFVLLMPVYRTLKPTNEYPHLPTGYDVTIMILNENGTVEENNWLRNFSMDWDKGKLSEYRDLSDVTISPLLIAMWNEFRTAAGLPDMNARSGFDYTAIDTAAKMIDTMIEAATEAMAADPDQSFPFVLTTMHNVTDPDTDKWRVNAASDMGQLSADDYLGVTTNACDIMRTTEPTVLHIVATQHCASTPAHQRVAYFTAMIARSNGSPYAMQITKVMGIGKCGRLIPLPVENYNNDLTSAVWEIYYTIEPKKG
jgi:hypothetical protein